MKGRWPAEHTRSSHQRTLKPPIFVFLLIILSLLPTVLYIQQTFYGDHFSAFKLRWDDSDSFRKRDVKYPKRHNMSECPPYFGNITIFLGYTAKLKRDGMYDVAQRSLGCYLKTVNYTLLAIDLDNDSRVNESCSLHRSVFYRKHCAVIQYLSETDWMLVLDADTGVVNPDHCIEEYIDDRVSILLIERSFNWELSAGNYLVKNSPFAHQFLRSWADYEFKQPKSWHGHDQGGLMLVICVRLALGSKRLWSGKIRIFNKAHGFVRDGWLTGQMWSPEDFMLHGWKNHKHQRKHPFSKTIDPAKCGVGLHGWHWDQKKRVSAIGLRNAPKRKNMQPCKQQFGSVTIFVPRRGPRQNVPTMKRSVHPELYKRHCAAAAYLHTSEWMLVIDPETGVVNPRHCIEEWIDDRVDIIFIERFYNWEIRVSSYLVRNSDFSRKFLYDLAKWEFEPLPNWVSYDQGAFMLHLLQTIYPQAIWEIDACTDYWVKATSYQTYMATVMCVRHALGAQRVWPGKVRIYRRMHGWVRDIWISRNSWSEHDFMLHKWKNKVNEAGYLFKGGFKKQNCDASLKGWRWKREFLLTTAKLKKILMDSEEYYRSEFPNKGRVIPYFDYPDIAKCYPHCERANRTTEVGVKALRMKTRL
ncbi:hypothetical protein GCK32_001692 [Trichostrongylus colubriformis]|uniref:Nucleotide-diphospho-sugar transferase domain-containing protein n=1 Tax=Trichostrongylus colubriformis TaxID=6319 RepID=A0AAN8IP24_TRICO